MLLAIFTCIPVINERINSLISAIVESFRNLFNKISKKKYYLIFFFFSFLIFWLFRSQRLYGDGVFAGYIINKSVYLTSDGAYNSIFILGYRIISALYKLLSGEGYPYGYYSVFGIINCLFGALFVVFLVLISRRFTDSLIRRFYICSIVLAQGAVQIFFGHVESYAIPLIGGIIFIYLAFRYLEDNINVFIPGFILFLTCALKMTTVQLYPALIILIFLKKRKIAKRGLLFDLSLILFIPFIGFLIYLFLAVKSGNLENFSNILSSSRNFFALINPKSPDHLFTIISGEYLIYLLNQMILMFPLIIILTILILALYRKHIDFRETSFIFLASMSVVCLIYNAVSYPVLGPFRDWDKYTLLFLPASLLSMFLLNKNVKDQKQFCSIALIILIFSLFHTFPWICSNNQNNFSLYPTDNYTHIRDYLVGSRYLKSSVGKIRDNEIQDKKAYRFFMIATEFDENLGGKNNKTALKYYNLAINQYPEFSEAMNNTGVIYDTMEMYNEASREFNKALKVKPFLAEAYNNVGCLFADWMWWDEAFNNHKKAAELNPQMAKAYNNLGIDYLSAGKYKEAKESFKKALSLNPNLKPSIESLHLLAKLLKS